MNSLKDIRIDGLKELKENGLKGLKVSNLKDLILKPENSRKETISDTELDNLTKKREELKREIRKLNQEKKRIEVCIVQYKKVKKEEDEEIPEFPWREEIFPPLPRKSHVKMPRIPEAKDRSSYEENAEFSEPKASGIEIEVKISDEKPEDKILETKVSQTIKPEIVQPAAVSEVKGAGSKDESEEKEENKAFSEKKGKIETLEAIYPFTAGKIKESKNLNGNSSENSVEKNRPEAKKPVNGFFGENLIEDLLNSDDLNPEEEQGFTKYLQEPEMGELINDLKDIKSHLARAEHAG